MKRFDMFCTRLTYGHALLALLLLLPCGCATTSTHSSSTPVDTLPAAPAPALPVPEAAYVPDDHNGSLWNQESAFAELFVLPKAKRVGDIVTIKIVESSSASNKATTNTERESSLSAQLEKFFGVENQFNDSSHPNYNPGRNLNPFGAFQGMLTSEFDGSGTTSRSNDLNAYITARVTEVLPGGNLRIVGSREVEVNNERQFIALTGVIRSRDISPENIIYSTYISEAHIAYSGEGIIADRQKPGWLTNALNTVWPF